MKNIQGQYYDLDKDNYLGEDYYDNLANQNNFLAAYIHKKRYQLTNNLVDQYYSPSQTIVDLACGNTTWNHRLLPVIGIDCSARMVNYSLKKRRIVKGIKADITRKFPLKNSCVDIVILTETLEHSPRPESILKQALRILKPRGKLIISVPYDAPISLWRPFFSLLCYIKGDILGNKLYQNRCGHVQQFSPQDIKNLLEKNGFQVLNQQNILRFIQYTVAQKRPKLNPNIYSLTSNQPPCR